MPFWLIQLMRTFVEVRWVSANPFLLPKYYRLFIEVNILWECDCVADYNPYCAGVIKENLNHACYLYHLQIKEVKAVNV
jgi:hypothetical protein